MERVMGVSKTIALASPSFSGGGAERVMVNLANAFSERGYQVDFIVGVDFGPYRRMLNPVVRKYALADKGSFRPVKLCLAAWRLFKYFRQARPHVMMVTIRELNIFVLLIWGLSFSETRLIVREADTLDGVFEKKFFKRTFILLAMRLLYKKADNVIANCNITRDDLVRVLRLPERSVHVIYNPLKIDYLSDRGSISSNQRHIVACGRLVPKKNFEALIRCVPLMKDKYPELRVVILGEGSERRRLEELILSLGLENCVVLKGFVENPIPFYQKADVFVQTSLWEGFGCVLVEAMACGTPVVAFDGKGAMREILENGKYGRLVPVGNLKALAAAIVQQIENPTPVNVLQDAVRRFDVRLISKSYLDVLLGS